MAFCYKDTFISCKKYLFLLRYPYNEKAPKNLNEDSNLKREALPQHFLCKLKQKNFCDENE